MPTPTARAKKTAQNRERRAVLERRALELSRQCPADLSLPNPVDCPLAGVRPLAAKERRKWIQGLSVEELEYLESYHSCCLTEKLATEHR